MLRFKFSGLGCYARHTPIVPPMFECSGYGNTEHISFCSTLYAKIFESTTGFNPKFNIFLIQYADGLTILFNHYHFVSFWAILIYYYIFWSFLEWHFEWNIISIWKIYVIFETKLWYCRCEHLFYKCTPTNKSYSNLQWYQMCYFGIYKILGYTRNIWQNTRENSSSMSRRNRNCINFKWW